MAPLMSLWGDGWFYLSGGGFLVSCLLFVFLLGQYRAAIEAEEDGEQVASAPASAEKVYVPRPIEPIARISEPAPSVESVPSIIAPVMKTAPPPAAETPNPFLQAAAPAPAPEAAKPPEKKKSEATTTGGLSPAVVYLQNLKTQVDHLDKELGSIKGLASQQTSQGELILNRLAELVQRLEALEASAPAAAPAPAAEPEAAPEAEPAPEPVPEPAVQTQSVVLEPPPAAAQEAPAPEPAEEPVAEAAPEAAAVPEPVSASAESTVVIEPAQSPAPETAIAEAPAEAPAPEPAAEPEPEQKPARKGPVWPI